MRKLLYTLAAAATAAGLFVTDASAWGRNSMLVPLEVAGACAAKAGATQPMRLSSKLVDGYFRLVQVEPGLGVTPEQSNRTNVCIAHYAGLPIEKVTTIGGKTTFVVRYNRCHTVLVGGDDYCVKDLR